MSSRAQDDHETPVGRGENRAVRPGAPGRAVVVLRVRGRKTAWSWRPPASSQRSVWRGQSTTGSPRPACPAPRPAPRRLRCPPAPRPSPAPGPPLEDGLALWPAGTYGETSKRPISEGAGHGLVMGLVGDMGRQCGPDDWCEAAGWSDRSLAGACGGACVVQSHRGRSCSCWIGAAARARRAHRLRQSCDFRRGKRADWIRKNPGKWAKFSVKFPNIWE
eukprot:SAG22_NODE_248_length_13909_cov_141.345112_3_plen_219_part_00